LLGPASTAHCAAQWRARLSAPGGANLTLRRVHRQCRCAGDRRNTFETVLAFGLAYGDKRVVVLTSRPLTCRQCAEARSNKCPDLRRHRRQLAAPARTTSISTEGSRFNDSCALVWSNGSSSLVFRAHWRRHSSLRRPAARCATASRGHATLSSGLLKSEYDVVS